MTYVRIYYTGGFIIWTSTFLIKATRRELAHALHNACIVDGVKVNVMSAIDIMMESLKRIILDASTEKLKLPIILPVESMEEITE